MVKLKKVCPKCRGELYVEYLGNKPHAQDPVKCEECGLHVSNYKKSIEEILKYELIGNMLRTLEEHARRL